MNEADLKSALVKTAREVLKSFVVIRHEDRFTHGIPDISFTGRPNRRTTWVEVKYANPGFACKGIQELTMSRLALAGQAVFVVYWQRGTEKRTYLVDPQHIGKDVSEWTMFTDGFNHIWVLEHIKGLHNDTNGS